MHWYTETQPRLQWCVKSCIELLEPSPTPSGVISEKLHGFTVTKSKTMNFMRKECFTIPARLRRFHVVEEYIANPTENDEIKPDHKVTVGGNATLYFIPSMIKGQRMSHYPFVTMLMANLSCRASHYFMILMTIG